MVEKAAKKIRKETKRGIVCRLRKRTGRPTSPLAGEVEIENISSSVIEIEVTMHPLQYLSLVITDAAKNPVPAAPYGNIFSPREVPYIFRLAPGGKFTHNVSLLGTIPQEKQAPGVYTVRATYEFNGLKATSDPVRVEVPQRS